MSQSSSRSGETPAPRQTPSFVLPGALGSFDESSCDWPTYFERAELFFEVNAVPEASKVPLLLTLLGERTYTLLKTLAQPTAVKDKSLAAINSLLSDHLNPKPKVLAQRCRFHKCQ